MTMLVDLVRREAGECAIEPEAGLPGDETCHVRPSLRDLAASGGLWAAAASSEARWLRSEAFAVVLPLVWERHTRLLETRKGHRQCAVGVCRLAPECADGFTDDMEAVVTALLSYRRPIGNLEGWITARMANAIKDGYRVRRSRDMGAQQRVRVPARLAERLGNDQWLVALADKVLQWAGVRHTAGTQLWPLAAWAEDRAAHARRAGGGEHIADDLALVLRTMREWDAIWYEKYVERPLGRKWAPVAADISQAEDDDRTGVPAHLDLVPPHERDDTQLAESAAVSLAIIRKGIAAGGVPRQVVADALAAGFLSAESLCREHDRVPLSGGDPGAAVAAVLADPRALDRVVSAALEIVA